MKSKDEMILKLNNRNIILTEAYRALQSQWNELKSEKNQYEEMNQKYVCLIESNVWLNMLMILLLGLRDESNYFNLVLNNYD
jgi:hypothetical protein